MNDLLFFKKIDTGALNETIRQALKYIVVGGLCTVLDVSLLYCLTHYCGISYLVSSILSFTAGAILNYFLCTSWIFTYTVVKNKYREFLYYILINSIGLAINTLVIWFATEKLHVYFMFSKGLAIVLTLVWNFNARKYLLHTPKPAQ